MAKKSSSTKSKSKSAAQKSKVSSAKTKSTSKSKSASTSKDKLLISEHAARLELELARERRRRKYERKKSLLEAEREALVKNEIDSRKEKLIRKEINQRIDIKNQVVNLGKLVLIGMSGVLLLSAILVLGEFIKEPWLIAVSIVAPITSITTITVMFFVGAFKKFDDRDLDNAGRNIASGLVNLTGENLS